MKLHQIKKAQNIADSQKNIFLVGVQLRVYLLKTVPDHLLIPFSSFFFKIFWLKNIFEFIV